MVNLCVQVKRADGTLIYIPDDIYSIRPEPGSFIVDDARQAWNDLGAKVTYSKPTARPSHISQSMADYMEFLHNTLGGRH